jgi:1-deoxy-D-xylulose 5-phosphate reductoisomerase
LRLAEKAGRSDGGAPAVPNAPGELAVEAFPRGEIGFMGVPRSVSDRLQRGWGAASLHGIEEALEEDLKAQSLAQTA